MFLTGMIPAWTFPQANFVFPDTSCDSSHQKGLSNGLWIPGKCKLAEDLHQHTECDSGIFVATNMHAGKHAGQVILLDKWTLSVHADSTPIT